MSDMITTTGRGISAITAEIRTITRQTQQIILTAAVEIGKRLVEAKELVPHGEWCDYLKEELGFAQSTANNYMRLYQEYGNDQSSLFEAKSQALENLPYTKALRLLAVPAEEREAFAAEVEVEKLSTRELEQAIRDRENAQKAAEAAEKVAKDAAEAADAAKAAKEAAEKAAGSLQEKVKAAERAKKAAEEKAADLQKHLKKAQEDAEKAQRAAEEAKASSAAVPDDVMEQLRRDAEKAAAEAAAKEAEKKVAAAEKKAAAAEAARAEAEKDLADARKAQAMSNPDAFVFKMAFQQVQEDFDRMNGSLLKLRQEDPALAEKMTTAARALCAKFGESLA